MKLVTNNRRSLGAWAALLGVVLGMMLAGCQAPLEQKEGGLGDFCNGGDDECRAGMVCQQGVCTSLNNANVVCRDVCDRFSTCGAELENCYNDCLVTLQSWAKEKTAQYQTCYTEDVTCEEITAAQKPQNICYNRLELPDERLTRCEDLRDVADKCLEGRGDFEQEMSSFWDACRRKGRTVSESRWAEETDKCKQHADDAKCGNMFACINENFGVDPQFPTTDPGSN